MISLAFVAFIAFVIALLVLHAFASSGTGPISKWLRGESVRKD